MRKRSASATHPADESADESVDESAGDAPESNEPRRLGRSGTLVAGRYRLESLVARGAMGEVWRARHEELNTEVAIKLATRMDDEDLSERMLERFRFEAQVSAQLSRHTDHVVAVHDAGMHRGVPFLTMEYLPGVTLAQAIEGEGMLAPERVLSILEQLAEALDMAHARGILHRDIKPANIMLTPRADGSELVKLADFGVAKALELHLDVDRPHTTQLGMLVGTPAYMSPEQIEGSRMVARSDLWSLGVCAYEALTGTEPFGRAEISDLLIAIASQPIVPPTELVPLPKALDAWFDRTLHKQPDKRFASAREMAGAFRHAIAPRDERRRWLWVAAAVIAGAALAVALSWDRMAAEPAPAPPESAAVEQPSPDPQAQPTAAVPTASAMPAPSQAPVIVPQPPGKPAPSSRTRPYDKSETL